jgi:hypothetical protein
VFVLRRSPDWSALAAASALGAGVAPDLYMPAENVPSFPAHIARCIERWDAAYRVGFFQCRAELWAIARATLDAVDGALTFSRDDVLDRLPAGDFRLFFLDDNDWFAPDAAARIACAGQEDVSVFPLIRLDAPVFTFFRERTPHSPVIGLAGRFSHRYQIRAPPQALRIWAGRTRRPYRGLGSGRPAGAARRLSRRHDQCDQQNARRRQCDRPDRR